jgi:ribonuclease D
VVGDLAPAALAEAARKAGRFGIDTEFMTEGRYRPLLCLVQVVVPTEDGQVISVLDPLEGFDHGPLADVLADPSIEVVMHAARQDAAILRRAWGVEVRNLFDTQIAAAFAGLGAQRGYGDLLEQLVGVRLKKGESFTRWDRRPLTTEQLEYARQDVEQLLEMAEELERRLEQSGRTEWAREECRPLEEATDERAPEDAFLRLPRVNRLKPRELAVVKELASWREHTAAEEDKPVSSIVADHVLVEIAKRKPDDREALEHVRGVHGGTLKRRARDILDAVKRGLAAEPVELERDREPPPDKRDAPAVALSEALVRARTTEENLAYELVATRSDLTRIVAAVRRGSPEPKVRTLEGWRREMVGAELLELLSGRLTLGLDDRGLRVEKADGNSRA